MTITKKIELERTEIVGVFKAVQVRTIAVIEEDGEVLSTAPKRHVLHPSRCKRHKDGSYTHIVEDISGEFEEVQAVCNAVWTDDVKSKWRAKEEDDYNEGVYGFLPKDL